MITVLIVDDHPVVRSGVPALLAGVPDITVAGEAASGAEAVAAARGETVLASVAGRLWRHRHRPPVTPSPREAGVLVLAAEGLSNADIGRRLRVSEATVKTHLLRAFTKLEVSGRTAAVTTAMRLGLI